MSTRKEEIQAMMNSDLEKLLIQVGDYDKFLEGELHCHVCGKVLNVDNIAMILPVRENDRIVLRYYCDDADCIKDIK